MAMELQRYRFTVDEYLHLAEAGILDWDERLELLGGMITTMHPTTRRLFTVDEYHRMVEAEIIPHTQRVELVEGELIEMPPSNEIHERSVQNISALMAQLAGEEAIVNTQMPLRFHQRMELRPDIMLLGRRFDAESSAPTPSDVLLLIEVIGVDNSNYVRQFKMPLYARAGIAEVWVVDTVRERLDVRTFANPAQGTYDFIERRGRGGPAMFLQMVADVRVKTADVLAVIQSVSP